MVLCFITSPELHTPYCCLVRETYHRWSVCRRASSVQTEIVSEKRSVLSWFRSQESLAVYLTRFRGSVISHQEEFLHAVLAHLLFRDSCLLLYVGVDKAPKISWLLLFSSYFFSHKNLFYFVCFCFFLVPSGEILKLFCCCGFREMKWL